MLTSQIPKQSAHQHHHTMKLKDTSPKYALPNVQSASLSPPADTWGQSDIWRRLLTCKSETKAERKATCREKFKKNLSVLFLEKRHCIHEIRKRCYNWGAREGWIGRLGLADAKPIYIERINSKVLMCITGNYIQHPVINHNGKVHVTLKIHKLYSTGFGGRERVRK